MLDSIFKYYAFKFAALILFSTLMFNVQELNEVNICSMSFIVNYYFVSFILKTLLKLTYQIIKFCRNQTQLKEISYLSTKLILYDLYLHKVMQNHIFYPFYLCSLLNCYWSDLIPHTWTM